MQDARQDISSPSAHQPVIGRGMSSSGRNTLLIASSLLIPLLLYVITIWHDYRTLIQTNKDEALRTVHIFEQHAKNVFETHQLIAERVEDRLKGMSWDAIEHSRELQTYLATIDKHYPQVEAIWLADRSGVVRAASRHLPPESVSIADRDYFMALRDGNARMCIGTIVRHRVLKHLNFNIAYRLEDRTKAFDGVVIVTVLPEYFSEFWKSVTSTSDSATIMLRPDGALLARSPKLDPELLVLPDNSATMSAIRDGEHGVYIAAAAHGGNQRIYAYQKLNEYGLYLVHGIGMNSVLLEWLTHALIYGALFSLATIALLMLAKGNVRLLTRLEQRVEERTAELTRVNTELIAEIAVRTRAEEQRLRLKRLFSTLYEANKTVIRADDQIWLFHEICRIIVEQGGFHMAWVGMVERETALVRPVAASGSGTDYLDSITISTLDVPEGRGPTGTAIREGASYVCNDFVNNPRTTVWRDKADIRGFKSSAAFALHRFGETVGALTIYATEAHYFDQRSVDLFVRLAADVSFALENMAREQQRKQLEQQLMEAKKLEAIGQIAGGVAHEVRNPLNAILFVTEALFKEPGIADNQTMEPYMLHIRTQVRRLSHLMNDLLELGKPILPTSLHPLSLREVCADAISAMELSETAKNHRLTFLSDNGCNDCHVIADRMKLQQSLVNLLENAIQHSPADSEICLYLATPDGPTSCGNATVLRITDSGRGIAPDILTRIFEPFFTNRYGGTGLGLALVRHYIDSMGGSVTIMNNSPLPGCTAEICLPRAAGSGYET